ncbi:MAG: hypothetical protein ACI8Y4_005331 [Candidatus Poriferisodalaceae bacterium]
MSVDTNLRGKNLDPYHRIYREGVTLLVNPRLVSYASNVHVDAGRGLLRRKLQIGVEHQHGPSCRH